MRRIINLNFEMSSAQTYLEGTPEQQRIEDERYLAEQTRIATDKTYEGKLATVIAESERLRYENSRILAGYDRMKANGENTKNGLKRSKNEGLAYFRKRKRML